MATRVLLNVDLGELPDEPESLYEYAHVANIACGGHAGDDASMRRAVQLCLARGTRVGAHPSYPDREGFGRRALTVEPDVLRTSVAGQCARLAEIAGNLGATVAFVKPHGALYHAAADSTALADAVIGGALEALGSAVTVVGAGHGELAAAAARAHLCFAREGFADRAIRADGSLVPREQAEALLVEPAECAERARALALRGDVETVCVHGDTPGAVSIARAVRAAIEILQGSVTSIALQPFGDAAWRACLPEGASSRTLLDALRALPRVVDAVVTERHAIVTFEPSAAPEG
jgi:UPF0271 protein